MGTSAAVGVKQAVGAASAEDLAAALASVDPASRARLSSALARASSAARPLEAAPLMACLYPGATDEETLREQVRAFDARGTAYEGSHMRPGVLFQSVGPSSDTLLVTPDGRFFCSQSRPGKGLRHRSFKPGALKLHGSGRLLSVEEVVSAQEERVSWTFKLAGSFAISSDGTGACPLEAAEELLLSALKAAQGAEAAQGGAPADVDAGPAAEGSEDESEDGEGGDCFGPLAAALKSPVRVRIDGAGHSMIYSVGLCGETLADWVARTTVDSVEHADEDFGSILDAFRRDGFPSFEEEEGNESESEEGEAEEQAEEEEEE